MPVKTPIPTLERIEPAAPTTGERINPSIIPDLTRGMEQQTRAAEKLGSGVVDYFQGVADNEADTESTKRNTDLQIYRFNRLDQLQKELQTPDPDDNPTKAFDRYSADLDAEYNRLTQNPNDSGLIKSKVSDRLLKTKEQFRLQDLMQYKQASDRYQDQIDDAAIDLDKTEAINNSGFVRRGDADSYAGFETSLENVRQRSIKKSVRNGDIELNEDGSIKQMNAKARVDIGKNISDTLYESIDNALKSGYIDVAQGIKEKYWNQIDPVNQAKLADNFKKADDEYSAYQYAREGEKAISEIKDPIRQDQIRDKGNRIRNDREKEREEALARSQKRAYSTVMDSVQKQEYTNLTQLEQDPIYSRLVDKMDHKQRQAVIDSVVAPKNSRDAALNRMNLMLYGGKDEQGRTIREYDQADFNELASGLSKGDRSRSQNIFNSYKTETGAQSWQKNKKAHDYFKDQAVSLNLLTEDEFNRISGKEFDKKIQWQNQLDEVIEGLGPNPPVKILQETVRDFTLSIKKGEIFKPRVQRPAFSAPSPSPLRGAPSPKSSISIEEKNNFAKIFFDRYKRAANRRNGELDNFIKEEKANPKR